MSLVTASLTIFSTFSSRHVEPRRSCWLFQENPRTRMNFRQGLPSTSSQPAGLSFRRAERECRQLGKPFLLPSPFLGGPDVVGEDRAGQTRQQQCSLRTLRNGRRRQKRPLHSYVDGPAPSLIERTAGPPDRRAVLRSVLLLLLSLDIAISIRASTRTPVGRKWISAFSQRTWNKLPVYWRCEPHSLPNFSFAMNPR